MNRNRETNYLAVLPGVDRGFPLLRPGTVSTIESSAPKPRPMTAM